MSEAEFKLTKEQRTRILAGGFPRIAGEGECPLEAGEVLELTTRVAIRVDGVRTPKTGGWSLKYTRIDFRDVFLAPTGLRVDLADDGTPKPMSEVEEHGMTTDPRDPIDAGVVVGSTYQTVVSMKARLEQAKQREATQKERGSQVRSVKEQLYQALEGLDPIAQNELLARISREINAAMEDERKAA